MNKIIHDFSVIKSRDSYDEWEMKSYFVSVKDGCLLETLVFFPKVKMNETTRLAWPVLLTRTPYSQMRDELIIQGQEFAKKGVAFAFQFCRGTGGSEGEFEPNVYERQDGIDTLNWLVEMEWCGPVCLHGSSYMALTAWVVADSLPDKVLGMFVSHYGVDRYLSAYEAGLFRHDILTGWALTNCGRTFKEDESVRKLYMDGALYRPHIKADRQVWEMDLPWYRDWISQTDHDSDYWNTGFWGMLKTMPKKVDKPIFIIAGWFDHHLSGTLLAYDLLPQEVKDKSRLLVGGWNHFFDKTTGDHENICGGFNMPKALFEWFKDLREEKGLTNSEEAYCIGSDDWVNPKELPVQDETYYFSDESIGGFGA